MAGAAVMKKTSNAGDIAERKKKKKRRRKEGTTIANIREAPKEAGAQQVASSLNLVLNRTDSAKPKNKRRLKGLQQCGRTCELPSHEASSEKEKQSLLAWVEMSMKPLCNDNSTHDLPGDFENGHFAKGRLSNGHAHANGTFDHLPNAHAFQVDHEGHVCGRVSLSNGHNSQSNCCTERCLSKVLSCHEGLTCAVNCKKCRTSMHVNASSQERSVPVAQVPHSKIADAGCTFPPAFQQGSSFNGYISLSGESELSCLAGATHSSLRKESDSVSLSISASPHTNKRKREDDKVLEYVLKRSIVVHPSPFEPLSNKSRTTKTVAIAWGRNIPVTLTSEACTVQEWISSQNGNLFGLDVEWRPNRTKGEKNKVALLQLCNESECLIIQMLFLDKKPQALCKLLSDPLKGLAGVGVLADGRRLLHDYGLECQGGIELTTLAVERLKRDELRNVGLKVLVQEVLGLKMDKPKKVTLSNWAKVNLDPAQINYACMDAWASYALSRKLLVDDVGNIFVKG